MDNEGIVSLEFDPHSLKIIHAHVHMNVPISLETYEQYIYYSLSTDACNRKKPAGF
jgi:hypothetical protein